MKSVERIKEALGRQNLVVVVGAGVSASISGNASTSTWMGLLDAGISHVEQVNPDRGALLRLRLETYIQQPRITDLTHIAGEIRSELKVGSSDRYPRWLAHAIGDLPVRDKSVPEAIAVLKAPIFTTNYDRLLESSLNRQSTTWSQPDLMRMVANGDDPSVGHLHGVYTEPDSVIFTDDDYRRVVTDSAAQALQTSAFTMKVFLFVGFGSGTDDPNFKAMIDRFATEFPGTANAHFRLCVDSEARPETEFDAVVDVNYGETHSDLAPFLKGLATANSVTLLMDNQARSREHLANRIRDNSALWRDAETLESKTIQELIVAPIFLPEPHDQYATNAVLETERNRVDPVNIRSLMESESMIIVAGEENAGVSTALAWILNEAMAIDPGRHAILIDEPLGAGPRPVSKKVERVYRGWETSPTREFDTEQLVLGVDNLRFENSDRFARATRDLRLNPSGLKVIGVRQHDALEVLNAMKEQGLDNVSLVYLGRFSNSEAQEIARRVSPGDEHRLVEAVMVVIREKHLPRNPFTITLLIELIRNGSSLKDEDSEIAVLDEYLNLLLTGEFVRERRRSDLTLRNKRVILVALARKFVEAREDRAPQSDVIAWVTELFVELGWPFDAWDAVDDLIKRRVLGQGAENTIRFQRSAYLELMAGIAAQEDIEFRNLVFSAPLQLASIVRTYAAISRSDAAVLELMETQIELITAAPPSGAIFASIRRLEAPRNLFQDSGDANDHQSEPQSDAVERNGISSAYYDDTDDSDRPAFLTARLEDLSPARIAMLVVDLASRVLRDTDEIRDQEAKARLAQKLLIAWVSFVDLYEGELKEAPDIDEVLREVYDKPDATKEEFAKYKSTVLRVVPSYVALSGIQYCLSSPSVVPLLSAVSMIDSEMGALASLMRTLGLYASNSTAWVDSLSELEPRVLKTWFSVGFLASLARFAYATDVRLADEDHEKIRRFLRLVIDERYEFKGIEHRNRVMNSFEDELRKARLKESQNPSSGLIA